MSDKNQISTLMMSVCLFIITEVNKKIKLARRLSEPFHLENFFEMRSLFGLPRYSYPLCVNWKIKSPWQDCYYQRWSNYMVNASFLYEWWQSTLGFRINVLAQIKVQSLNNKSYQHIFFFTVIYFLIRACWRDKILHNK